MGSCISKDAPASANPEEKKRNEAIEKELRQEKRAQEQRVILLLLGAGESGKSTFAKQMKIIFLNGYTEDELISYRNIIRSNCIMGMRTLLLEGQKRGKYMDLPEDLRKNSEILTQDRIPIQLPFTEELASAVFELWKTDVIQEIFKHRNEFQLSEFVGYYCERADKICQDDYVPTVQDILHARARTIGIKEITFTSKDYQWKLIDVGGQRNERKKWIHCFEDVTAIIFFADSSGYNMTLFEDERVNRLLESLTLFEEICNCKYFDNTPLIVFLNKSDLLRKKIQQFDIAENFPDYKGGNDFEAAVVW
eukprot:CAMPEP_0206193762 /NCGR_PEP_ID=MMETSP0166-20121206/6770_1 /ASSEMBLY_ACC=CAM_ASM_000260 /TAXON_ID=95228 /ORGANISM="Vannella robusta, Strain DIVA3 518/3/11/1/6" /LENGTH=307 /DNA_ID=CAMNT_0053610557 /DNA_START=65 /DNA_END=985 /DNA_ORIENTATION=-